MFVGVGGKLPGCGGCLGFFVLMLVFLMLCGALAGGGGR